MHEKMAEWPIKKLVISMSGPAVISMTVQGLYNVVDGFFLARLGQSVITAIAIVIPFFYIVFCIGIALGIGANSLISRRLGAKKIQEAGEVVEVTLLITCILGIIATIGGVVFSAEFMSIFTADSKVIVAGSEYISALSWFFIPILGAITTEKMIQATGEMKFPMYTSVLGGVINMILEPIFIFGLWGAPKMGIIGASVASGIGVLVTVVLNLYKLYVSEKTLNIHFSKKLSLKTAGSILSIGIPTFFMQALVSIAMMYMAYMLAKEQAAVAVLGIYSRINQFIVLPVVGVAQGTMPILGYSYGARNQKRFTHTFNVTWLSITTFMLVCLVLLEIFATPVLKVFNASPAMLEIGPRIFRIIALSFIFMGTAFTVNTAFFAIGKARQALFASVLRQLIGVVGAAFILIKFFGIYYIWWAYPIAEVLAFIYVAVTCAKIYKNEILKLSEVELRV